MYESESPLPNNHQDRASIAALNQEIAVTWDTFRWLLGIHYKYNKQLDTPYWQWCRENLFTEGLLEQLFDDPDTWIVETEA